MSKNLICALKYITTLYTARNLKNYTAQIELFNRQISLELLMKNEEVVFMLFWIFNLNFLLNAKKIGNEHKF